MPRVPARAMLRPDGNGGGRIQDAAQGQFRARPDRGRSRRIPRGRRLGVLGMSALTADPAEVSANVDPTEDANGLLRRLKSGDDGLSSREAARRLIQYGPNELRRRGRRRWPRELARQFTHPLALPELGRIAALSERVIAQLDLSITRRRTVARGDASRRLNQVECGASPSLPAMPGCQPQPMPSPMLGERFISHRGGGVTERSGDRHPTATHMVSPALLAARQARSALRLAFRRQVQPGHPRAPARRATADV